MDEKVNNKRIDNLLNGIVIYGFGVLGSKVIGFLLLPLNTAKLTPAEYGITDMISVIISLLMPFATLQIGMTMYKELLLEQEKETQSIILTNGLFVNIVFTALIALCSIPIIHFFYPDFSIIIVLMILLGGLNTTLLPVMRGLRHNMVYTMSGCISTVIITLVNAGLVLFTSLRIEAVLLATLASNVVTVMYMAISAKIWTFINPRLLNKKKIIDQLKFGIPMIPRDICWWINNSFNRFLLNRYKGNTENGYFVVTQKFTNLYGNVFSVVSMAWNDSAIQNAKEKDRKEYYNSFYKLLFRFMMCIYLLILPAINLFYNILVNVQYSQALSYIPLLMLAAVVNQYADLYASLFLSINDTKKISTTAALSTTLGAVVGIFFIPKFGIWGIAFSTCVSSLLLLVVRAKAVRKKLDVRFPIEDLWLLVIALVFILTFHIKAIQIPFLFVAAILSFLLNKSIIHILWNYLTNIISKLRRLQKDE